jgi:asparagine synthase (glutamine-hydrolysing)
VCGIAGIVATDALREEDLACGERMRDILIHRGPDGAGTHADAHALLAHRRLSIVDLAGGHQPLSNEDGTVWVTYNGEIYNHADVRAVLEGTGHRYRTKSVK